MNRFVLRLLTLALAIAKTPSRKAPSLERAPEKILVAHYLLLGDTLLLSPLMAKLASRYPEAEKIILTRPDVSPLFSRQPFGFRAIAYDPKDASLLRRLCDEGPFDLAFVLGDNRYSWLARAAGARWIVAFENDRPGWKNWMVDESCKHPEKPTAWADMAASMVPGPSPAPYRTGDWPSPASELAFPLENYALLHVGASTPLKTWPAANWRALANELTAWGIRPVWSAGRSEASMFDAIGLKDDEPRFCGDLDLSQLWRLLTGARLLVCPDTGIGHMGKLVSVPTVALFGPGSPSIYGQGDYWRNVPYLALAQEPFLCRDQKCLFRRELDWVRRCGRNPAACAAVSGHSPASGASPPCMRVIGLDAVYRACRSLLTH